ncbi:MAG TPA: hybrid sensor histidine kinase/response regulator [Chthoniobacterales bacterium]
MIAPPSNQPDASLTSRKRLVLIVDDLPENLQVLAGHLTKAGYEILAAPSGARAIALVRNRKPDIILLDIMMPIMDGLEVCRALKADPESADIPVIFITARADTDDVLQGFQLGAVDYITKPFKADELVARVRTHLDLKAARDMLLTYNHQLERLSKHLRRLNEDKNRFLGIVSHDIRGAFGNVVTVSRLFADTPAPPADDMSELLRDIGVEAEHMIALAQNLLNIDALERRQLTLQKEPVETGPLLDFAIHAHQLAARVKNLRFFAKTDDSVICGDGTACRQILTNLVSNAVKYSVPHSSIWLDVHAGTDGDVVISVRDEGPGLSTEDQRQLFRPFTRLGDRSASHEHSVGLGLSIVKLMAEGMGGTVRCDSQFGAGATFIVTLPAA